MAKRQPARELPSHLPLSELLRRLAPDNPKDHDIGAIIGALQAFGYMRPIGVNALDSLLLWGHGTTEALAQMQAAKMAAPNGIETRDGDWLIPVEWRSLAAPQAKAYRLADNRTAELGGLVAGAFEPDEVWCATGSGMLARCLGLAFPGKPIIGIAVGLQSRWSKQPMPVNVEIRPSRFRFEQQAPLIPPWPADPHYEAKAWLEFAPVAAAMPSKSFLFWNVLGP